MPTPEQNTAIMKWQQANHARVNAIAAEETARKELCDAFFPNGHVPKGTNTIPLGNDYELKIVGKLNFSVDNSKVPEVKASMKAKGDIAGYIADNLFKAKYDLSITEYNKLPPDLLSLVLPAVTSKPGMPTVEVVAPKPKSS